MRAYFSMLDFPLHILVNDSGFEPNHCLEQIRSNFPTKISNIFDMTTKNKKNITSINLRAVEPEDLELLYLWENDRTVWHVSNTMVPFSHYQLKRYIDADPSDVYTHKQIRLMIDCHESEEQTRTVGSIDLFDFEPVHQRAGLGILIASAVDRRHGYAYEAILQMMDYCRKILFLHQLYCNIAASNKASIQLFVKAGFEITGTKKDWLRTENGWEDEHMLQLKLS
jgi:diamine N-acetyltransferase